MLIPKLQIVFLWPANLVARHAYDLLGYLFGYDALARLISMG
jgi:hypothetical protein